MFKLDPVNSTQFFDRLSVFITEIVKKCAGNSKLCEKVRKTTVSAGNGLKCEYMRETAKSVILHPPHLYVVSELSIKWVPDSTAEDSTAEDSTVELYLLTTLRRSFS